VLETNMTEILTRIEEQTRIEKQEVGARRTWSVPARWFAFSGSRHQHCSFRTCLLLHSVQVHYILGELCFGGLALETNMAEILTHLDEQNKLEKQEVIDWPPADETRLLPFCAFLNHYIHFFDSRVQFIMFCGFLLTFWNVFVMLGMFSSSDSDNFREVLSQQTNFPIVIKFPNFYVLLMWQLAPMSCD